MTRLFPEKALSSQLLLSFDGLVLDKEPRSDLCSLRRHGQRYTSPGKRDMMSEAAAVPGKRRKFLYPSCQQTG